MDNLAVYGVTSAMELMPSLSTEAVFRAQSTVQHWLVWLRSASGASSSSNSLFEGNYIGTNAAGTAPLGDAANGIVLTNNAIGGFAHGSTIGGDVAAAANLIYSNGFAVSLFTGSYANTVQGNLIGINPTETGVLGGEYGIWIAQSIDNTIGGPNPGDGNIIGGEQFGIFLTNILDFTLGPDSSGNAIQGNFIGVSPTGTPLSNDMGIALAGVHNNLIGGTASGDGNTIELSAGRRN